MQTDAKTLDWWDTGLEFIRKSQMGREVVVNARDELIRQECSKCHKMQPASEFTTHSYHRYNKNSVCKACESIRSAKDYLRDPIEKQVKSIIYRSEKRKIPCNITAEFIRGMYATQEGKCFYTGIPFGGIGVDTAMSIDRVNSKGGYTQDNVVLCCTWVNMMKSNYPLDEFYRRMKLILDHSTEITLNPIEVSESHTPQRNYPHYNART